MPPSPEIIRIGDFALRWYSVMIVLGALAASWLATREARRRGQDPEHVWQMLPFVLIAGIAGARLGWVLVNVEQMQAQGWQQALFIWEGGLSIQGAIVGGMLALIFYVRRARLDFFEWADIIVPGLALAQAIGRWGNYFNQEAFGGPCNFPWCIPISQQVLQSHPEYQQYIGQTHFHPAFAYEMIWDLFNFAVLMWLGRQRRFELRTGDLFWAYGIIYSLGRFFIEEIRIDSATVGGLKAPTIFALITIVACWAGFIWRHRPGSDAPVAVTSLEDDELAEYDEEQADEYEDEWETAEGDAATAVATGVATQGLTDDPDYLAGEEEEELDSDDLEYDEEWEEEEEPLAGDELEDEDMVEPQPGEEVTFRPTAGGTQNPRG